MESEDGEGLIDELGEDKAEYDNATVKASVVAAFSEAEKNLGIVFEHLTHLFSETQVPLIHQAVPALLKLRDRLQSTVKDAKTTLQPLPRVAAYASLK
ncbi:hypothetical protein FRC11_005259, partial [Ceratobasidium sp. 423]